MSQTRVLLQLDLILQSCFFYSYLVPERRNHLVHNPLGINNTDLLMSRLQRVLKAFIEDRDNMFESN
jgi:hypothetical protein